MNTGQRRCECLSNLLTLCDGKLGPELEKDDVDNGRHFALEAPSLACLFYRPSSLTSSWVLLSARRGSESRALRMDARRKQEAQRRAHGPNVLTVHQSRRRSGGRKLSGRPNGLQCRRGRRAFMHAAHPEARNFNQEDGRESKRRTMCPLVRTTSQHGLPPTKKKEAANDDCSRVDIKPEKHTAAVGAPFCVLSLIMATNRLTVAKARHVRDSSTCLSPPFGRRFLLTTTHPHARFL